MCLLAFRLNDHPVYDLVFAGNRDEHYDRPTAPANFWEDHPHVLGGRDLRAGGTWMGVTRTGRWGVITNVRDPSNVKANAPSRGHLVSDFLTGLYEPFEYVRDLAPDADGYNGFNLLVGEGGTCAYLSNYRDGPEQIAPGVHGISNAVLNTSWPKTDRARAQIRQITDPSSVSGRLDPNDLLQLLDERRRFPDDDLPETGVGPEVESILSPIFIESESYGTRASTVLLIAKDGTVTFVERTFNRGTPSRTRRFTFDRVSRSRSETQESS
ncbi:hypothetical protein CRI94_02900 [Longibacter salinarum]|uniref:NRDE family protein n=1 Tax=Longibacter salinarum TaxID=1850348 RepID=A0A2A8D2Z8_9BACT|nr:NRDE family protein [Longibacter salinarum]PEN15244.1 hypothetical protein CRI94_02900 [Longibacter salinarum]